MIYVIMHRKLHHIIYVGQTAQELEKRISAHVQNIKYLQRHRSFKENSHKCLISLKLAIHGLSDVCVLPQLHFKDKINATQPISGTAPFRKRVEQFYEFKIAEALHSFWPTGCNLSGNPLLSLSKLSKNIFNKDVIFFHLYQFT